MIFVKYFVFSTILIASLCSIVLAGCNSQNWLPNDAIDAFTRDAKPVKFRRIPGSDLLEGDMEVTIRRFDTFRPGGGHIKTVISTGYRPGFSKLYVELNAKDHQAETLYVVADAKGNECPLIDIDTKVYVTGRYVAV